MCRFNIFDENSTLQSLVVKMQNSRCSFSLVHLPFKNIVFIKNAKYKHNLTNIVYLKKKKIYISTSYQIRTKMKGLTRRVMLVLHHSARNCKMNQSRHARVSKPRDKVSAMTRRDEKITLSELIPPRRTDDIIDQSVCVCHADRGRFSSDLCAIF